MAQVETEIREYNSVLGAKLLLAVAHKNNLNLNITKVQKLLYIIYSYFLAKNEIRIFNETPKAWPYGPVFPRTRNKVDYDVLYSLENSELAEIKEDAELLGITEKVVNKYAQFTAGQLSDWSHMEGSPWDLTTKLPGFKWGDYIPDEYIIGYFSKINVL